MKTVERVKVPEAIEAKIRNSSMLAYLRFNLDNWEEFGPIPFVLTKDRKASTHGSFIDGKLIFGIVGSVDLAEGTEGYLFIHPRISYSEYVWIGDAQYPAKGAKQYRHGADYTFVTELEDGRIAHCFESTTHEKREVK